MRHRPDIDGLRAVAVLPVVIYHTGMGLLPGGYLGVDIFFVISGYLITSILIEDLREGRFSIARFYQRRILRLFPALFAMLGATVVAAWVLLFPAGLEEFGQTLRATVLFLSNLHFAFSYGYFSASAESNPLLHTWSLAVEEQFYILFPLMLAFAFRRGKVGAMVIGVLLASFAAAVILGPQSPESAFFLLHTRAWEMLIGAVLAVGLLAPPRSDRLAGVVGLAGMAAIFGSMLWLDRQASSLGLVANVPAVLGAAALLWAGARPGNLAARVLSVAPARAVGLISYSLYLWHWPIFVFWKTGFAAELTVPSALALCALSGVMAAASWYFIEQPARRLNRRLGLRHLLVPVGLATALLIGTTIAGSMGKGWPDRFAPEVVRVLDVRSDYLASPARACLQGALRKSTNLTPDEIDAGACRFGATGPVDVVIWGDSHAGALIPAFEGLPAHRSAILLARPGCPPGDGLQPIGGLFSDDNAAECVAFNAMVRRYIEARKPQAVLMIARWAFHLDHEWIAAQEASRARFAEENVADSLRRQVDTLATRGIRVGVLAPIPYPGLEVPEQMARDMVLGVSAEKGQSLQDYTAQNHDALQLLQGLQGAQVIAVAPILCKDGFCPFAQGDMPVFVDSSHLSPIGALSLKPALDGFFAAP